MTPHVETLPEDSDSLKDLVIDQAGTIHDLESKIESLEAQLRLYKRARYQSSSEKHPDQTDLFEGSAFNEIEQLADEPQESSEIDIPAHKRQPRKPRQLSPELPRVEVVHDLAEHEKQCSCGNMLEPMGEEVAVEQLAIIPAQHYVIRHIKKKYACRCGSCIKRATSKAQPIPKSQASPSLLAFLMVSKFLDGLPLYRMEKIIARDGLAVSRQNMARWLIQSSTWFDRIYDKLEQSINNYDIASGDETRIQVLKEPGRSATSKSWLWIRRGGPPDKPAVLIDYNPSRASTVPESLFSDFKNGYLVVDACPSYHAIAKKNDLTLVGCHDHARRKFKEAYEGLTRQQKQKGGVAKMAIERYKKLYRIEKGLKGLPPEEVKAARQQHSLPLLEEFKRWLEWVKQKTVMTDLLKKAVNYFLNQYKTLIVYCEDGRLPIANIETEHVAKAIALARKNYLFCNTPSGAQSSAKIYSMIITAVANGLNPLHYLTHLLAELPGIKGNQSIEHLLPWSMTAQSLGEAYSRIPKP